MNETPLTHLERAKVLFENDQPSRAKRIAERVLRFNPGMPEALEFLANIEMFRGRFANAIPLLEQATESPGKTAETWSRLGFCYRVTRQNAKALKAFEEALKLEPKQFQGLFGAASVLIGRGELEKAQNYLEKAIKTESKNLEGYRLLATLTDKAKDKAFLDQMLKLVPKVEDYPVTEKAHLHLAIASCYQKQEQNKKYAEHLDRANKHLQEEAEPWFEPNKVAFEFSKEIFTKDILKKGNPKTAKKFTPIFIVGLPRSGSTLLEQILAGHSKVFGADEMPFIRSLFVEDMSRHYGILYPKFLPDMTGQEKLDLAESYQRKVQTLSPKSPFIIDKMVGNSFFVGMIKFILPWAKVIHIKRHPADMALSIYSSFFAPSISYANDLGELAKYFRLHVDYMQLWGDICGDFIHEVKYEDLVKNLEKESKKITDFCGLKWEESCLDFQNTQRDVLTLSAGQVRKGLYTSSIGKWKDHEALLKPFLDGAKDLFKDYGY